MHKFQNCNLYVRLICLNTAVTCTVSICLFSNEKLLNFNEDGNVLVCGFVTIILHCLNLEDSSYYTAFVASFQMSEVHMGEAVTFWQCLSMFISKKNEISKHLKVVVGVDL